MKATVLCLATALFAGNALAAEYGVGASAKSDDGWIYFPIDVSEKFRIEPHLRYATTDTDSEVVQPGFIVQIESESDSLEIGVGLFGLATPKESVRLYYGGRLGYVDAQTRSFITDGITTERSSSSTDGYRIASTVGFEYLFNKHFTLGGEVAYFYEHREGTFREELVEQDLDGERTGTATFLILRYFF